MRRAAIVGDAHGNAVAWAAVVAELERDPPELVVVNGDLSWGPEPEATLALADRLAETVARVIHVRGNGESALERLARDPGGERTETEAWMLEQHSAGRISALEQLAGAVTLRVEALGRVFVCHGSPRGDQEIVTPGTPDERMRDLLSGIATDVLVTGHVHLQFQRRVAGIVSANAGSVGLPYGGTPAAYWAELGVVGQDGIAFRRTVYDLDEAERRFRASGSPTAERLVGYLRAPPPAEEVIEDGERRVVAD